MNNNSSEPMSWGFTIFLIFLGLLIVLGSCFATFLQNRQYTVEYLEGNVISLNESNGWTHVTLDNGGGLNLNGKYNLILGETYRFTFWKYDDWWSNSSTYKSLELVRDN